MDNGGKVQLVNCRSKLNKTIHLIHPQRHVNKEITITSTLCGIGVYFKYDAETDKESTCKNCIKIALVNGISIV